MTTMTRAIGDVRPSQVITTFGPGAIVDLQTLSVIVAGIDSWPIEEESVIHEPRLERALRVKRFFPAKANRGQFFYQARNSSNVPLPASPGLPGVPDALGSRGRPRRIRRQVAGSCL